MFVIVPYASLDVLYQEIDNCGLDVTLHHSVAYSSSGFLAEGCLHDSEEKVPINIVFYTGINSIHDLANSFDLVCNTGYITLDNVFLPICSTLVTVNNPVRLRRDRLEYLERKYPLWDFSLAYKILEDSMKLEQGGNIEKNI